MSVATTEAYRAPVTHMTMTVMHSVTNVMKKEYLFIIGHLTVTDTVISVATIEAYRAQTTHMTITVMEFVMSVIMKE
jgi:hypothetical protein